LELVVLAVQSQEAQIQYSARLLPTPVVKVGKVFLLVKTILAALVAVALAQQIMREQLIKVLLVV
jgi:hypothetical protein